MKTLRVLSLYLIAALAALLFVQSLALADSLATPTSPPQNLAELWPMIGLALANIVAYGTRKLAGEYTFFHTGWGSLVLALFGAIITTVTPVFQSGHVTWIALGWAVGGGVTSFLATLNPSTTATDPAVKSPSARPGTLAVMLPLAFVAFALSACAHLTPDQKAFGTAYGSCMEVKGLAVVPTVASEVWGDLNNGVNLPTIVTQLEALAGKAGTDAVACAVSAWLTPATVKAAKNPAGVAAASIFLAKHSV